MTAYSAIINASGRIWPSHKNKQSHKPHKDTNQAIHKNKKYKHPPLPLPHQLPLPPLRPAYAIVISTTIALAASAV